MSDPVSRVRLGPSVPPPSPSVPSGSQGAAARFADILRATGHATALPPSAPAEAALRAAVASVARGEQLVEGVVRAARRGATFSNEQLIAIQAGVYRYTQELELAGKLVDKATGAVRQTLQSQQ